jgi:hypothetical protein
MSDTNGTMHGYVGKCHFGGLEGDIYTRKGILIEEKRRRSKIKRVGMLSA